LSATNETITRDGGCPVYLAYITNYCIVDDVSDPKITRADYNQTLQSLAPRITGTAGPQDIKIPSWQRKLVWDKIMIDSLVNSESSMFGTVILSKGDRQTDTWTLIDGLQRFSSGTALIHALYHEVLSSTPNRPTEAPYFETLKDTLGKKIAVIEWNHKRLSNLGKRGVKASYISLYEEVKDYVTEQLDKDAEKFATAIIRSFLIRQVAVDPYAGFGEEIDLIRTFFSINSTGEKLSKIDLLRARILGHLEQKGLDGNVLDEIENNFTDTFQKERGNRYFTDLGIQMYNIMYYEKNSSQIGTTQSGQTVLGHDPFFIFPNWDDVAKEDFDEMFEYHIRVAELPKIMKMVGSSPQYQWPYLAEIFPFKLPYIMLTMYYYKNHYLNFLRKRDDYIESKKLTFQAEFMKITLTDLKTRLTAGTEIDMTASEIKAKEVIQEIINNHQEVLELEQKLMDLAQSKSSTPDEIQDIKDEITDLEDKESEFPELLIQLPDFLGGKLNTQNELKKFYRAVMRKLLDGNIGKTDKILHMVLRGTINSMDELCKTLSPEASGDIDADVNRGWLKSMILKAKKTESKIIFNACLLPDRNVQAIREQFKPFIYKTATNYYHIDHLIPDSKSDSRLRGKIELQNIVNFAPLESDKNRAASNTPCSLKLTTSTIYDQISQLHPYCKWLVEEHCPTHMEKPLVYPTTGKEHTETGEDPSTRRPILDSQINLTEGDASGIAMERVDKLIEILLTKL
jgi:hypothetical protein